MREFFSKNRKFDVVVHLAGMSHVRDCEANPDKARDTNVTAVGRLLQALLGSGQAPHFVFASSGQVYAQADGEKKLSEDSKLDPINCYAKTKLEAEQLIATFADRFPSLTVFRIFNHTHKSQSSRYFVSSLYHKILALPPEGGTVTVGNLDVMRDIGALQDLLDIFSIVIGGSEKRGLRTYNICSGKGKNLRDLAQHFGRELNRKIEFAVDPKLVRIEPEYIVGDPASLMRDFDWMPQASSIANLIQLFQADLS
jgi:nucleoside-diphosphate-sugar epimerase